MNGKSENRAHWTQTFQEKGEWDEPPHPKYRRIFLPWKYASNLHAQMGREEAYNVSRKNELSRTASLITKVFFPSQSCGAISGSRLITFYQYFHWTYQYFHWAKENRTCIPDQPKLDFSIPQRNELSYYVCPLRRKGAPSFEHRRNIEGRQSPN